MASTLLEQIVAENPEYVHRLTVGELREMLQAGILREGRPVELIDGLLLDKDRSGAGGKPIIHGPKHASAVRRLQDLDQLVRQFGCHVRTQLPITLSDILEPEPDGVIAIGDPVAYASRHPSAAEIVLAIEAADSSLAYDRTTKQEIYAGAGIPEYWIINLRDAQVEIYRKPNSAQGSYAVSNIVDASGQLTLQLQNGQVWTIPATMLLG